MAITITSLQPGKFGFCINAVSADVSGCEELKAAPGAGKHILIDHITLNCGSNPLSVTIGQGETEGAVTTALIGPVAMSAGSTLQWNFAPAGFMLAANTALVVDASGAGDICVFVIGRIE